MSRKIEIIISPTGESRVETKGFAGSECREASRFLESALGRATSESLTAEFHEARTHQHNHLDQET
ncbi:DUF2997 domain-containing protein [Lignipirellula cremea]|uniref:DUF2997 domain-containing protein n=1 Tax=Lignipirellula cremea TaxID=2528010 RepID=A0A518DXG7_9BACT|nr:DUF2997 domain-containing protein [Lignipirellula cremea]QDU96520.1 hypothetical protein Pla8534_43410 [Lignipirellula cremea]